MPLLTEKSRTREPWGFRRILKTAGWMILMAILVAWIAALAFPLAIKAGLKESTASRLPNFGLLAGAALGLTMSLATSFRHFLGSLGLIFVTASVFWFFGVELEGVVIAMGVPEEVAEWISPIGFCFGALLCGFALSVELYEKFAGLGRHKGKKQAGH